MAHLKCHSVSKNKESWENIPEIVAQSITTLDDNFKNVRRWALDLENTRKEEALLRLDQQQKLKQTNEQLKLANQKLNFLFVYANQLFAHQRGDCRTITACLQQHLGATRSQFKSFGHAFGVEIRTTERKQDELGDLQALVRECQELDGQLASLDEAFLSWQSWRSKNTGRIEALEGATQELHKDAESTHDRLCSWREKIKENQWTVQNLSEMLSETRGVVSDLCANRVTYDAMDEALGQTQQALRDKISQEMALQTSVTEQLGGRCDNFSSMLDSHVQDTDERMNRHNNEVLNIMQSNLTPVTQYLNSMHVKSDEVKAQLTTIQKQVPTLESGLEEARALIKQHEQERQDQFLAHDGRIESLEGCTQDHIDLFTLERNAWTSSIEKSRSEVDAQVDTLKEKFKASENLQEDHVDRMVNLEESLSHLQQKVAKWVHMQPLPVKVSEARIFALEARINEEIDRRLQLEARVETTTATPATSRPHSRAAAASPMPPNPGLPRLPAKSVTPSAPPHPTPPPHRPPSRQHENSPDNMTQGRKYSRDFREDHSGEAELLVASTREKKPEAQG